MSQENSYPLISSESGEPNGQLGVDHEVQGGLGREHGPRTQHWILQLQKNLENSSNMSNGGIMSILFTSGELNGQLGVDHGIQGGLEREHRLRTQRWIVQLQKNQRNSSNMSNRGIMSILFTSGEYIRIYLILWIISIKEKEVAILQWHHHGSDTPPSPRAILLHNSLLGYVLI